ncbi:hypothetical protein RCL_jg20763.t1 [Rhizophagus clarus]|uniref:Uncharacterized protein n=1 Tax=Rhizophagus clarus TaxID=94130 RepID=A0A8H3LIS3_9GLOM|nr:hypothetical protein RCL_jg20763.t1 [Rhizophagus clarus]
MQAESSINYPSVEFFLSNDHEYDSDKEILDLLGYFMKEITPKLVCCKCGKEICLDWNFRDKNLTTHGELSNCKYSGDGQQSIKVFFKPKKIRNEEENIIVKKVASAKQLFSETVKAKLRLKSLGTAKCDDLKNYLRAHATWILDKTTISVRSKECENFTIRKSGICDNCDKLRRNNRLIKAINKTTGLRYSEHLKQFFSLLSKSSREYEIFRQMLAGISIRSIRYLRAKEVDVVTNLELVYENLTYSDELGGIVGSTLKSSEIPVQTYDDIHNVINYIKQQKAIATQVRVILLKIPIEKIPPLVISMLPTKGESNAAEIYDLLMNIIIMSRDAGVNLVSLGSDGAPVEYNAQQLIMNSKKAETFFEFHDNYYNVHFQVIKK